MMIRKNLKTIVVVILFTIFHLVHYVLGVVDEDELMFLHDVYIKKKK